MNRLQKLALNNPSSSIYVAVLDILTAKQLYYNHEKGDEGAANDAP